MSIVINEPYESKEGCTSLPFSHFEIPSVDYTTERKFREVIDAQTPVLPGSRTLSYAVDTCPFWINLSSTTLELTLCIKYSDGSNLKPLKQADPDAFAGAAFVNNIGASIIKNLSLTINQTETHSQDNNYGMASLLVSALSFGEDCRRSKLERSGWSDGIPSEMDAFVPSSFRTRCKLVEESRPYFLSPPLFTPLAMQGRYMVSNLA